MDKILPAALYVLACAFLDDVLIEYIKTNSLAMGQHKETLNGRIEVASAKCAALNTAALHVVRVKRNEIAHEPSTNCKWAELDAAICTIHAALETLSLAGKRPNYKFYFMQEAVRTGDPPHSSSQEFHYGLTLDGKQIAKVGWTLHYD